MHMQFLLRLSVHSFSVPESAPVSLPPLPWLGQGCAAQKKKMSHEKLPISQKYLSSVVEKLRDVDTSSCDNGQFGESVVSQISIPHTVDPVSQNVSPDQICHHLTIICSGQGKPLTARVCMK